MGVFLSYAIPGVPAGSAVALMAVGIVLTYRTTGVVHFAFAAQAYIAGLIYATVLSDGHGVVLAGVLAIVVAPPLLGIILDLALFSHLTTASATARVVVSLVVLFVFEQVPQFALGSNTVYAPRPLLGGTATAFTIAGTTVSTAQVGTVALCMIAALVVGGAVSGTRFGLLMRAAVESPRLLELSGVRSRPVTSGAWALSSLLAGLAGVVLAPTLVTVDPTSYWVLFVGGVTAAAIAGFSRFGIALLAAVLVEVVLSVVKGYLPQGGIWQSAIGPGLPFFILAAAVLFAPGRQALLASTDPLSVVDPPIVTRLVNQPRSRAGFHVASSGWLAVVLGFTAVLIWLDPATLFTVATGVALATALTSITLVTGMSGQLSMCQISLAGLGAFTCGQLDERYHLGFFLGALLGGLVAGAVAAVVALLAQRLRGLSVMLLTFCVALLCDQVVFQWGSVGGGFSGVSMPAVNLPGIAFTQSSRQAVVFGLVLFAGAGFIVNRLRQGTTGLFLAALRESEAGAAAVGIQPTRVRVATFSVAGVLAGIGGAYYAALQGIVSPASFDVQIGLLWLVAVCAIGATSVWGALVAGLAVAFAGQPVTGGITLTDWALWLQIGLAAAAVTYAWRPQGILDVVRAGAISTSQRAVSLVERVRS